MSKKLKLIFSYEDGTRTITITNPKDGVSQDDCKTAMDNLAATQALEKAEEPVKAVLTESTSEVLYEA